MGHVTPGYEFAVVDKDTGELCAEGETGELWMRGTRGIQLFLEYFDNPEANEKAFEDGWFKTGDMVHARRRRQPLLPGARQGPAQGRRRERLGPRGRGRRSPRSPGVAQVAVVGKQHDFLDQVVVAFVITTPDAPDARRAGARRSSSTARGQLADFKVPRAVYVVDEFPLGTLDKILKNKLREMADEQPAID